VILRDADVFVHVEGNHVLEGNLAFLVETHQLLISTNGRGTGRQTKDEGFLGRGLESLDALHDMVGGPTRHGVVVLFDNYTHFVYVLVICMLFQQ